MNFFAGFLLQIVVIKISWGVFVEDAAQAIESCEICIRRATIAEDDDAERQDKSDEKKTP
jgi:hypothetical protein